MSDGVPWLAATRDAEDSISNRSQQTAAWATAMMVVMKVQDEDFYVNRGELLSHWQEGEWSSINVRVTITINDDEMMFADLSDTE